MNALLDHLSETVASEYHERGFVVVREFFAHETMDSLDRAARELWSDPRGLISPHNLRCRYQAHHASGEKLFECFDPVIDLSPHIASVATESRLLAVLAAIYGEPAHLFKDKLIFKPPGAAGYPLHQDYIAWSSFPRSFLTVLVPLDEANEENGCTMVYEGRHRQGLLTPADGKFHPTPRELVAASRRVPLLLEPGDIAIFHGFTPHESQPNRTSSPRRQLYLSYNAHSEGGQQRAEHYAEFHRWLREKYPAADGPEWYFE
jgi:ectoine hydroxylase-related dioxygenase (phytanoyl-CoA dioxygenase family)